MDLKIERKSMLQRSNKLLKLIGPKLHCTTQPPLTLRPMSTKPHKIQREIKRKGESKV